MGMFENFVIQNGEIVNNIWIEWYHGFIPNKPEWFRKMMRSVFAFLGHCLICTSLDGCYFVDRIKPEMPQHKNCDCYKKELSFENVKTRAVANCSIKKFIDYIFTDEVKSKGKKAIFESWGYTIDDAESLKYEFEKQGLNNYLSGNYILKSLDMFGQRIGVPINLRGNEFFSGWLVKPEGKLENITPLGGWIK